MLRVVSAITSAPWLMPASYLRALHAIATRDPDSVPDDIRARYEARQRGEGPHAVITNAGERLDGTRSVAYRDGVAIVPVIGPIFRYADFFTDVSGALTIEDLGQDFAAAMASPKVQDVILYIDSPGGEASGIHEFANIVRNAADTSAKRVIAYIPGIGASAAYWIASACSEIVVDRTAMAPCIGVVFAVPDPSGEKDYIEIVSTQSPKKRLDVTTDDGRAQMQKWADDLAAIFISCVASNRGVSEDIVMSAAWGEGSLDIGQALVAAGVADRLGSFEELVSELISTRRAGAPPQNKPVRNKENTMRKKTTPPAANATTDENAGNNSEAAAQGGECDCCAIDSTPCGCPSKDETADGVCSCTPDCPNCAEHECDGEQEPAAEAEEAGEQKAAAAAAVPPARSSRRAAAAEELKSLRTEVSQLRRKGVVSEATSLIENAVRELKMPPLPTATKDGKPPADTLSSLLRDTLVDSQMNDGCSTCQANHGRVSKIVALLPPVAGAGRLTIKPVKEAAAMVGGAASVEQADLHIAISEKLLAAGLNPGTKKYATAYNKTHAEMTAAAAASAVSA